MFTEVIVAAAFDDGPLAMLREPKNIRVLRLPADMQRLRDPIEVRPISGGILVRQTRRVVIRGEDATTGGDGHVTWRLVAGDPADEATFADLSFAWRAIRAVKSNAILLAKDGAAVGIGMGQVQPGRLVPPRRLTAGAERATGSVAASDAFFPFADGLEVLLDAGVRAVVAPGARSTTRSSSRRPSGPGSPCTSPVPALRPLTCGSGSSSP